MWHADENFDPDDALHTLGFDLRASFSTCAIVGSSGALLHDRRGAEIDAHDLVIRFNNAPVAGYEAVVGSRTDLRLLNSHAIAGILQRCARFSSNGTCAPVPQRHACCPKAKVLLNSGRERIALCYRSACGGANAPGQANVLTALSDHPLILAFKASLPASQSLLSGVHAIAVAQLVCKRRISLYGFTSEPRWRASADGVAVQPSYHYYDDCAPFASDGLSATATSMNSPWFRQRFASSSRINEFAARVHMVGPSARHHPRWVRWNATTAASRPASCASRSAIGVINSILRRAEKASRQVPCCKNKSLEAERMGRYRTEPAPNPQQASSSRGRVVWPCSLCPLAFRRQYLVFGC
jgi:hypothetical protein